MRDTSIRASLFLLLLGCGHGEHGSGPPSSTPIPAVNEDAVYVVSGGDSAVVVLGVGGERIGAIALANAMYPHHLSLSADRARLLVAVPGVDLSGGHAGGHAGHEGAVLLLEAATGRTLAARTLPASNHNAIFSPDGSEVWTSQMGTPGTVLVLDPATLATRSTLTVGAEPSEVTFSRDGRYAFVADGGSSEVTVIDVASKETVKTIGVGAGPVGAWPGLDGVMYVDCETARTIVAIDGATLATLRTINLGNLGFTPGMAATPPGLGELWVSDADNGRVVVFQAASGAKLGEIPTAAGAHGIAFSGDGKTAWVSNQGAGSVTIVDVAAHAATKTVAAGSKPNGILFRAR